MAILVAVLAFLFILQRKHLSFNKRVFTGLVLGAVVGVFIHYTSSSETITKSMDIYSIFANGYVKLLQMLVYPIICVAVLSAMTKIGANQKMGKPISIIIFMLLFTVAISALVGILVTLGFGLNLDSIVAAASPDQQTLIKLVARQESFFERSFSSIFTDFITTNPFADMTGARGNSIASLVIFFILVGIAYLGVLKKDPATAEKFKSGIDVLYKIVMRLVVIVLRLTPYGIFALFTEIAATSSYSDILSLANFVVVTYISIIIMFIIHLLILVFFGFNILTYVKKVMPLLLFAFASRSSASAIPMNIRTQTDAFGVQPTIASIGSSFGAIMGQNGCAGIYPAVLAVVLAPSVGIDPTSISFILSLIAIITISSFGIAGVGGGATFAAIAVLSTFNMPLTLVALLIGIEPILDMARTMLNVNDSVLSSLVSAKTTKNINMDIYNDSTKVHAAESTM
jgi:L-cystine uptake protein TcyP (sodium:dicarboxylate symporter family)